MRQAPLTASQQCRRAANFAEVAQRSETFHGFLTVQGRGTVALPPALRSRMGLDSPGAQVEVNEREDGVLELRPTVAVPAADAWFWDRRWQTGEREVDAHVAAGQVTVHPDADALLAHLDELDELDSE